MQYLQFLDLVLQQVSHFARARSDVGSVAIKDGDPNQVVTEVDIFIGKVIAERIPAGLSGAQSY